MKTGKVKIASLCDPEITKTLLTRLCTDAGAQILFETVVSRPVIEGKTVTGVIVENKAGRSFVGAKVVIDCSADGDMAAGAGAPFTMGSGSDTDTQMQPVGMYFTMSDVDTVALAHWARDSDDIPAQAILADDKDLDYGLWLTGLTGPSASVNCVRHRPRGERRRVRCGDIVCPSVGKGGGDVESG